MRVALTAALTALTLSACGTPTTGLASPSTTAPDPKTEWTKAVTAAGFIPNPPHTYADLYAESKASCAHPSALAIAHLAWDALVHHRGDLTAPGQDPNVAAAAIGNATWRWSCGHQDDESGGTR